MAHEFDNPDSLLRKDLSRADFLKLALKSGALITGIGLGVTEAAQAQQELIGKPAKEIEDLITNADHRLGNMFGAIEIMAAHGDKHVGPPKKAFSFSGFPTEEYTVHRPWRDKVGRQRYDLLDILSVPGAIPLKSVLTLGALVDEIDGKNGSELSLVLKRDYGKGGGYVFTQSPGDYSYRIRAGGQGPRELIGPVLSLPITADKVQSLFDNYCTWAETIVNPDGAYKSPAE